MIVSPSQPRPRRTRELADPARDRGHCRGIPGSTHSRQPRWLGDRGGFHAPGRSADSGRVLLQHLKLLPAGQACRGQARARAARAGAGAPLERREPGGTRAGRRVMESAVCPRFCCSMARADDPLPGRAPGRGLGSRPRCQSALVCETRGDSHMPIYEYTCNTTATLSLKSFVRLDYTARASAVPECGGTHVKKGWSLFGQG